MAGIPHDQCLFYEKVPNDRESTTRAGFSIDGGRVTSSYYFNTDEDAVHGLGVHDAIRRVLGGAWPNGNGAIFRGLPLAHPHYPWMFAERITAVVGMGEGYLVLEEEELEEEGNPEYHVPTMTIGYYLYPVYRLDVEFTPRPYALLQNDWLGDPAPFTWYDVDNDPVAGIDTYEYYRFTEYDITPNLEIAYAQHGQLKFRVNDDTAPDGYTFSGFPRINIPKCLIKFRWYCIPFSYIDHPDSYLVQYLGRINQNDFMDWDAGSLLYSGLTVTKRYPQVIPDTEIVAGTTGWSTEKLCDIEFAWEYTKREAKKKPPTPKNRNWVYKGHNLLPFLGGGANRGFYAATSVSPPIEGSEVEADDPEDWVPIHWSVDFRMLFLDPGV